VHHSPASAHVTKRRRQGGHNRPSTGRPQQTGGQGRAMAVAAATEALDRKTRRCRPALALDQTNRGSKASLNPSTPASCSKTMVPRRGGAARRREARRKKMRDGKKPAVSRMGNDGRSAHIYAHPPNLPIVKRWGSRMGNYWRVFFLLFSKKTRMGKRDGELLEMLLDLHEFQNLHTRVTCE